MSIALVLVLVLVLDSLSDCIEYECRFAEYEHEYEYGSTSSKQ